MPRPGEPGRRANGGPPGLPRSAIWAAGLTLLLFAVGLTGCSGLHKHDADDPLVGPGPKGLKADPAANTKANSPVPPIPAANASASTADLAAGQLVGGRPLGIDDRGGPGGWQGAGPDSRPLLRVGGDPGIIPASGGVILQRPEPLGEPATQVQPLGSLTPVPSFVWGQQPPAPAAVPQQRRPSNAATRLEQLQNELTARGAINQRQQVTPGGVSIRCAVPDRANPDNLHVYEATAPDAVAALQALISKIDQNR